MRRNGVTIRSSNDSNEVSSRRSFHLEDGCGPMPTTTTMTTTTLKNGKSHATNGIHPTNDIIEGSTRQQRRRRIGGKKQGFLEMLFRLLSRTRRKPHLVEELLVGVTVAFLLLFWISLVLTAVMREHLEDKSKGSAPVFQLIPQNEIDLTSQGQKLGTWKPTKNAFFETKKISQLIPTFDVVFLKKLSAVDHSGVAGTDELDPTDVLDGQEPVWDLDIEFFEENGTVRQIFHDYEAQETHYRPPTTPRDDDVDMYYAFDDDSLKSHRTAWNEKGKHDDNKRCRRISDHRRNLQNCNSVHEVALLEYHVKYLGEGSYRQVFGIEHEFLGSSEKIIVKDLQYSEEASYENFEYIRMDAIVAERLTASPRVFDIYGFCGLSILSEFFPHGDIEQAAVPGGNGNRKSEDLHDDNDVNPQNNMTAIEKLQIGTQMAEALVDLHGYRNGVIVHDDIQLSQFLYTADKSTVKINDFNRAEFMLWDDKHGKYCKYKNGKAHGTWRAPEEYFNAPLNEKIDVWSLGNNLYSLLTGLWPFYDEEDSSNVKDRIRKGETGHIDPRYRKRSIAEAALVNVIEMCFRYYPDDRPSIFEIAVLLREALTKAEAADEVDNTRS